MIGMSASGKWKAALKRVHSISKKRLRVLVDKRKFLPSQLEFFDKILDPAFSMMNLRNDERFWSWMGSENDFNTAVVETIVAANSSEKIETFFSVIFMKVKAQEIFHMCLQKMYNKFINAMVDENQIDLLENLFEINFNEWENEDFNPKMQNLPALVKACMNNKYEIVRILVANGFLLR